MKQRKHVSFVCVFNKDFAADMAVSAEDIAAELVAAAWLLREGAFVARLRSAKDAGCSGFHSCDEAQIKVVV